MLQGTGSDVAMCVLTLADVRFLRAQGWDLDIAAHHAVDKPVIGLCGGYQMMGTTMADPEGTEGPPVSEPGLSLFAVTTVLASPKTVRSVVAQEAASGLEVIGYETTTSARHSGTRGAPGGDGALVPGLGRPHPRRTRLGARGASRP